MLTKAKRLTAHEVRAILKEGRSVRAGSVSAVYVSASSADKTGRAAMVVSKSTAKKAVERNRLRRQGYAALPPHLPKARMVFFIRSRDFNPADIATVCSKLSS